jgi:hypothetical protein
MKERPSKAGPGAHGLIANKPGLFEFKMRTNNLEAPLSETRVLFSEVMKEFIDGSPLSHHAHVAQTPAPLNAKLKATYGKNAPDVYATAMTAYHQVQEWGRILNTGGARSAQKYLYGHLTSDMVPDIYSFFRKIQVSGGKVARDPIDLKFQNVGVRRLSDNTFSFEHRINGLPTSMRPESEQRLAEAMAMAEADYSPLPWSDISKFTEEFKGEAPEVMASLWPIGKDRKLYDKLLSKTGNGGIKNDILGSGALTGKDGSKALLLSHWDLHPFVRYDEELRAKVVSAQENALMKLKEGEDPKSLADGFWQTSGLAERFREKASVSDLFDGNSHSWSNDPVAQISPSTYDSKRPKIIVSRLTGKQQEAGSVAKADIEPLIEPGVPEVRNDPDLRAAFRYHLFRNVESAAKDHKNLLESGGFKEAAEEVADDYANSKFYQLGENSPLALKSKIVGEEEFKAAEKRGKEVALWNFDRKVEGVLAKGTDGKERVFYALDNGRKYSADIEALPKSVLRDVPVKEKDARMLAGAPNAEEATIRNAMVESGGYVRGARVYSEEYLGSAPPALKAAVKLREASADKLAAVRRDYFSGNASFRELEEANRLYGTYERPIVGTSEAARRVGYLQQEEEYMAREIAKAQLNGNEVKAMTIDHAALSAQLLGETKARGAELGAGGRNAREARRGVIESFTERPQFLENYSSSYSRGEMKAALGKKGLSEDEITKCMELGECGKLKYAAKEESPSVEPSLLAQKVLVEKELSATKPKEAKEARAIANPIGRPTNLKEAKSLLEKERKELSSEASALRKEAKQLSDGVKERHEELLDQYGRPSLYSAFTREGHGDVWHDDDPWREGPSDAARVKLWDELPDLNRNGNASFADLQKAAKKDGVTTVIPYPRPKTAIEEREMEMIYGSKLKFSTDKKKGVPYVKGKGVALHPGVEPELASIFRGDFNPHLGTGLAANRLDKWREYKLANTLSPGSMSETTNAPALFKKAAATSELAPAKREALKADVLSCIAHSNGVCSPSLEERIRSAVQDFFVLTEKEFPDGAFIKLTNEFATADGGKLITTFKSDRKALADQFIHDLKVLSDEKKTYTPDELDYAVELQEHRGSSLTHGLLFDPKKVMAQKKLDLVETEQGRPMEFRIPFFNMEATAAIPRHTSEYLPEEAAAAKKAFNDAFAQSKKRIAIAGGADMVKTKDGSYRLMEFNVGGESGYGMGDSAPVASNRIVAAIQGKDTKMLEELKAIDNASPSEQSKLLQGLNENSKNMFLEETMISVRDSAMEKWKKSPTVANGRETIENLQAAFKGVIHDQEHEGHEMILSAAQYMRRTHPEESAFDDLVKSIEKTGPLKPELDDATKAAQQKAAAKMVDEARKYLSGRIETLAKYEKLADNLRPLGKDENALGNRAVAAVLKALGDPGVKRNLEKIDSFFGNVNVDGVTGAERFAAYQKFKNSVMTALPATKRVEVYKVIAKKIAADPGPFGRAFKAGAKVDETKLVAALRSSDNLTEAMGAKSPELTHALYTNAEMGPEAKALADAVGISKASNESSSEAKAALTAELKSNAKRSLATLEPPKGSADKLAKEGLAEIEGLSDAQRAELAKSIATIEKNPNGAQAAVEHMQMMARNPDLFETYRMAYKGAGDAMAADSKVSREAAWKAGVAKMLKESGYDEGTEEFTRALHNTLACLKM